MYQLCLIKHYCQHQTGEQNTCIKCVLLTWKLPAVSFSLCFTLLFPLIIYSIRWLETLGPFVDKLFSSLLSFGLIWSQFSPSFSNKHKYREAHTVYTNIVCLKTQKDRRAHLHRHTKPPSGQGLTLTLKGLCLAPVIATPQAGYVVRISMSMPQCVYEREFVWNHNVWGELLQTPPAPRADSHMGSRARALWFCFVGTTEKQQFHQQYSEKQNNCAFDGVCLWWWGDRKWDHAEGSGCVCAELIEERGQAGRRIPITY